MKKFLAFAVGSALLAACSSGVSQNVVPGTGSAQRAPAASTAKPHYFGLLHRTGQRVAQVEGSGPLYYRGGYVQPGSNLLIVTWGFSPSDSTRDPDGVANRVTALAQALDNSANGSWNNTVTQYTGLTGYPTYTTSANMHFYVRQWADLGSYPPSGYTDASVQGEVSRAAASLGNPNGWAYVILTPTHVTAQGFMSSWCGYHGSMGYVSYVVLPYMPDAGGSCGENTVNGGAAGINDGTTIVAGHEFAEMVTDPFPNTANTGWTDSQGYEIGDKCAWTGLQNVTFQDGASFAMQPLWSNANNGCVQSYATPTPGPAPSPRPTPIRTPKPCINPRYCL